jgi:hypothetical protein
VIAARYLKQSNYDAAAEILAGGAKALLRAGSQQGASASGGDLAIMLVVEVYDKAEWEISDDDDTASRTRKSMLTVSSFPCCVLHHQQIITFPCFSCVLIGDPLQSVSSSCCANSPQKNHHERDSSVK